MQNDNIAKANLAFGGGQYEESLKYAKSVIATDPNNAEGYYCAGKACMSLERYTDAIEYFVKASSIDKKSGNGFFLLGYAQVLAKQMPEALKNFTRAIETGNCDNTLKAQIYKIMAMLNTDQELYEDALVNLRLAQELSGIDYELLQQKAACYAFLKDYRNAIFTLNQMKLLQPRLYLAYSLAFNLFMELEMTEQAEQELDRAKDFAYCDAAYYNDRITLALVGKQKTDENGKPVDETADQTQERYNNTLNAINEALRYGRPDGSFAFELYLRATQMYISLNEPDKALKCLEAADNPVRAYNNGFDIFTGVYENSTTAKVAMLPEYDYTENSGEYDNIDPNMLTPVEFEDESVLYIIKDEPDIQQMQKDFKFSLYVSVYEMKENYDQMLEYGKRLGSSTISANKQAGAYFVLKAKKHLETDNWEICYRDKINEWTKNMIADPTDFVSAAYRIRAHFDIGEIDKAKELCACLPEEIKKSLLTENPELEIKLKND